MTEIVKPGLAKHVVVVGAGIVGVSAAIWLQRSGSKVTIVDREGPASGTSYGNAGVLAAASIVPVPVPGLLKKAPGLLFNKNQPLFLRWTYLPKLLPFLTRFLRNAKDENVQQIAKSLSLLLHDCADQHTALAKGTGAEKYLTVGDYLFGYKDRAAYEADAYGWNIRRKNGHKFVEMDADQLAAFDPSLAGRFGFAVRCPEHGHISDPGEYVKALASHFENEGGQLVIGEVEDIESSAGQKAKIATADGVIEADEIVIATGVWSGPLAKKLGMEVPLESERGYHLEFINPSVMPKSPIMVTTGKYVMTPMNGRLRCAGVVEFGGLEAKPSQAPFDLLLRQTMALIPELTYDRIEQWMGHRPSTPDSLPVIGKVDNTSNVWSAFGHQHIGLSGGPKTGRWIAQMISGQEPNVDLTAFAPNRFR